MAELIDEIKEYVNWQAKLISQLKSEVNSSRDWDDPYSIIGGNKKVVQLVGETWVIRRHGMGCSFTRTVDGLRIDALRFLGSAPSSFEAWSIEVFLDSKGVNGFTSNGKQYGAKFSEIDACLSLLEKERVLKQIDDSRVYEVVM